MKKTVRDMDVKGKRVLVRCDFNVPMQEGKITDDTRIVSALPTIRYLTEHGAKVILMSHMGRPKGEPKKEFTLQPVADRLTQLLGKQVIFAASDRVVDENVQQAAAALADGDVMLLENVRFRKEETQNDAGFAKELASLGDIFVNDAFGTAHRAHASTAGIADYLPCVSGFLIEKEVQFLGNAVENPERPFVAIMGGAKVGDKIPVIENLLKKVDALIIGGWLSSHREGLTFRWFGDESEDDVNGWITPGNSYEFDEKVPFDSRRDNRFEAGLAGGIGVACRVAPRVEVEVEGRCYYALTDMQKAYMKFQAPRYNTTFVIQTGCNILLGKIKK